MASITFRDYIQAKLTQAEIHKIDKLADLEHKMLLQIQAEITRMVSFHMNKHKIGIEELAKNLNLSLSRATQIQKGKANLTLHELVRLSSVLNHCMEIRFKECAHQDLSSLQCELDFD